MMRPIDGAALPPAVPLGSVVSGGVGNNGVPRRGRDSCTEAKTLAQGELMEVCGVPTFSCQTR